jgi:hypothetical protein
MDHFEWRSFVTAMLLPPEVNASAAFANRLHRDGNVSSLDEPLEGAGGPRMAGMQEHRIRRRRFVKSF